MVDQNFANTQEYAEIKLENLKDLGDLVLGLKLLLNCSQSTFIGVCHSVLYESKEIILEQVSIVNTGARRFGLVIVLFHDIITLGVLGVDRKARHRRLKELHQQDMKYNNIALMKRILPPSLNDTFEEGEQEPSTEINTLLPKVKCDLLRPADWRTINELDDNYKLALYDIRRENVVSIFACGIKLGRNGTLAWFCCEAHGFIYLFDVAKLGPDSFVNSEVGKAIFADDSKVKILHNGRRLEDYLHHRHGINMTNVFDTQASDIYMNSFTEGKKASLLVKSLPSLLQEHLTLSNVSMRGYFPRIQEEEESMWLERPLPEGLIVVLIHSVMFLRELRDVMLKKILTNLEHINRVFLSSLRDKPSLIANCVEEEIVPPEIQTLIKQPFFSKTFNINYTTRNN